MNEKTTATKRLNVLVVDDERAIRDLLRTTLEAAGYNVVEAADAREGAVLGANRRIDLFLIDLGLPDQDGIELVIKIRKWTQRPILVLSARTAEHQKVMALDAGADDYLTKPFGVDELHARIRVALRHSRLASARTQAHVKFGDVCADLHGRTLTRSGSMLKLTATEWRLLDVLIRHGGRVVTGQQLLKEVWGPAHSEQSHYLRIYIRQLRQKLEPDPSHPVSLITETGVGYRLILQDDQLVG